MAPGASPVRSWSASSPPWPAWRCCPTRWRRAETLTFLLAAYFVATGVVKAVAAFQLRPIGGWAWALASAAASILLGLVVFSGFPGSATWAIGLLVGIDLLFYGMTLLAVRAAVNR